MKNFSFVLNPLVIAVDFDGTIVEHKYPSIGKEIPFAVEAIKLLQGKGHRIILWTYRTGPELDDAVLFCRKRGVEFYAVNKNYPEEKWDPEIARKINADIFIDDRNIGGLPSWTSIIHSIHPELKTDDCPPPPRKKYKWW